MSLASTSVGATEVSPVETAGKGPLLLLLGSALAWLLVSGVLALVNATQLNSPDFLAGCSVLTFGRAQALQETAFIYGWIGNAGLALALWVLGRLGGEPLRASNWISAGAVFWNLGIAFGLIGIATGDATGFGGFQLPRYVQPLLLVAYGAMAVAGVLAWTGRRRDAMYAAQWYAVAALFLFPWIFSAAQVMLLWVPVRGTLEAIVAGWFVQGLWTLWIAPLALAGAYYIVPRISGRVLPGYDMAPLGFWCLVFVGAWTGGRHLIGGPAPAWIATTAIVAGAMMLFHYATVLVNLRFAFGHPSFALKFIAFGLLAYGVGGLLDAMTAVRSITVITQFTYFDEGQRQLALYGAASMMLFGVLYFAVPRLAGRPWSSAGLAKGHLTLSVLGLGLLFVSLAVAGLIQGRDLNDAKVAFATIAEHTRTWLMAATAAQAMLLLGNLLLAVNFLKTAACPASRADQGLAQ